MIGMIATVKVVRGPVPICEAMVSRCVGGNGRGLRVGVSCWAQACAAISSRPWHLPLQHGAHVWRLLSMRAVAAPARACSKFAHDGSRKVCCSYLLVDNGSRCPMKRSDRATKVPTVKTTTTATSAQVSSISSGSDSSQGTNAERNGGSSLFGLSM